MKNFFSKAILVILALVVFAVSAYAWSFVQNSVDINGIKVQPSDSSSGIAISKSGEDSFSVQVSASTVSAQTLSAVSTYDLESWFTPSNVYDVTAEGSYSGTYSTVSPQNASGYYYSESFKIKTSDNLAGLKVSDITVNTAGKNISKALRVGIKISGDSKSYIFAPVSGYDSDYAAVTDTSGGTNSVALKPVGSTIITPFLSETTYTVTVFVWYEGQDENYTAENLKDTEALEISIEFLGEAYN